MMIGPPVGGALFQVRFC